MELCQVSELQNSPIPIVDLDYKFESGSDKPEKFQIRIHRTAIQTSIHIQRKKTKKASVKWGNAVTVE